MRQRYFILWTILISIALGSGCENDNKPTVVESYHFDDGALRLQKLKNENFSGFCYQSYYANGKKEIYFCTDSLGQKVGKNSMHYESGQLKQEQYYKNGILEGIDREYYPNGQIKSVFHYRGGSINGVNQEFYDSGALKSKMIYIEDQNIFYMSYNLNGDSSLLVKPYVTAPDTVYVDEKFEVQFDLPVFSEIEFKVDTSHLTIEFDMIPWETTNDGAEFSRPRFKEEIDSFPFTIEAAAVKKGDFVIYGHLSNSLGWKQKNIQSATFIKRLTAKKKVESSTI